MRGLFVKVWSVALCAFFLASCSTPSGDQKTDELEKPSTVENAHFQPVDWAVLEHASIPVPFWEAFLKNCAALKNTHPLFKTCALAKETPIENEEAAFIFFKTHFNLFTVQEKNGEKTGLVTGYYEPIIRASKYPSARFRYPIHAEPKDLLMLENGKSARYRLDSKTKKLHPYWNRAELSAMKNNVAATGEVLFWAEDSVEVFFLQIQGSGRVLLENGEEVALNFANHNGHPYRSIGQYLISVGELSPDSASMAHIQEWVKKNPKKGQALLNKNPRYIFFKKRENIENAVGALGVPLTEEISVAVDKNIIPLGAPLFLKSTMPNSPEKLERFVLAQDVGSAIQGAVRVDFFWGVGEKAGALAGMMKQPAELFLIWPKDEAFLSQ